MWKMIYLSYVLKRAYTTLQISGIRVFALHDTAQTSYVMRTDSTMLLSSYVTEYHSVLIVFVTKPVFLLPGGFDIDGMFHVYVDCSYLVW